MLCAAPMGDRTGVCLQWECWAGNSSAVLEGLSKIIFYHLRDDSQHIIPITVHIVGVTVVKPTIARDLKLLFGKDLSLSYNRPFNAISLKTDNLYTLSPLRRTSLPDPAYSVPRLIQSVWANPGWREMQRQRKSFVRVRCQFPPQPFRG